MNLYKSIGTLKYGPGIRLVVEVDQEIANFYRSLIPKWKDNKPQRYSAHISVVRHETPIFTHWEKYQGEKIEFIYNSQIINDESYYWLNVECEQLKDIRKELGLKGYPWWTNLFHITIANCKKD